jgi:hypothetical protein
MGRERKGDLREGDLREESPNARKPVKATCTVHSERTARVLAGRRACQDGKHFEGARRRSAIPAFLIEPRLDLKMRRIDLNQVEREWIVIRCVKTFVHLPAVYLNRAARERPVDLSPRFK